MAPGGIPPGDYTDRIDEKAIVIGVIAWSRYGDGVHGREFVLRGEQDGWYFRPHYSGRTAAIAESQGIARA
jgi:hypothetical protein